ncbi:MAG: tetratricopeptide repeat protein, partial [bacterium]|nr:tetratricopeptide repeat protein [bacterium]
LALLYGDQGRFAEVEPLYERSLKIWEKALGDEHPDVATALENFALLLRDTERTSQAEEMEARARTIRERHAARERERGSEV